MQQLYQSDSIKKATSKYNELSKYLWRSYEDRPIEVLPGIFSNDDRLLSSARDISEMFSDIKVSAKDGFVEHPYFLGNLDQVRQIAGFNMNPLGSRPPVQKVSATKDGEFIRILKLVTKELTSSCIPTGISLNKISSIGFPERTNNIEVKTRSLKFFIDHFDEISKMVDLTLANKKSISDWTKYFNFMPISIEGRRSQHTDKISRNGSSFSARERDVFDWKGNKVKVSRSIKGMNDMFRTRSRFVYGATGHLNYGAQFFASSLREYMGSEFDFLFYTGPHNFADKISSYKFMVSADVTQFDQNFDDEVANVIIDNIQCYDDRVKNLMRLMVRMPVIKKSDYIGQKGWTTSSDIDAVGLEPVTSNPSGWAWVTEFAKICGVAIMATVANQFFKVDESNINDLLKGRLRLAFLNTGDDMVFLFKDAELYSSFKKRETFIAGKFKLDVENTVNYLGMSLRKVNNVPEIMLDIRNIIVKTHVPERSIGSVHKPYFAYGLRSKLDTYSKHPAFEELFYNWNAILKKHFGKGLMSLAPLDKVPSQSATYNVADAIFLENPDSIHYKLKRSDVSKDLLDSVYSFIDLKFFNKIIKHLRS